MSGDPICLGIDGCAGGWICAVLENGSLDIFKYGGISDIIASHSSFGACLIDIPIGLRSSPAQVRPDECARRNLKGRASTIFSRALQAGC